MTTLPVSNDAVLDASLTLRTVRRDDLHTLAQLIYDICEAEGDTSVAVTPDDLANEWAYEGFNPEQDAFLVETRDGRLTGYAAIFDIRDHCELSGDIYVHPLDNKDETGKAIFAREGYLPIRYHWRMGIELSAAPLAPVLPAGLELRPFVKDEHATHVWQARNEAFQDNWSSHALTFDEFGYYTFDNPEYDPTLWRVIWDGNEVAGFSINHHRMGIGWIHMLGVRPAWRTRGLGLALLQHSFGEFYRRGTKTIGLGVDASNPTGATRLYQRVGMQIVSEFVTFEKELRA